MRRVLVDYARYRLRAKRGGKVQHVSFEDAAMVSVDGLPDLIAIDQALERLSEFDPLAGQVVELRYFGGLSWEETAEAARKPLRTVQRKGTLARDWLYRELKGSRAAAKRSSVRK